MSGNRADWVEMFGYPTRLAKLQPGESALFICSKNMVAELASACRLWVRNRPGWMTDEEAGDPPRSVLATKRHPDGLLVSRGDGHGKAKLDLSTVPTYLFLPWPERDCA